VVAALSTSVTAAEKTDVAPTVTVAVDEDAVPVTATALVRALREERPRTYVSADDLQEARFTTTPLCLPDEQVDHVLDRIRARF
jgi:hypothetical protein